jgi:hypothetical protein
MKPHGGALHSSAGFGQQAMTPRTGQLARISDAGRWEPLPLLQWPPRPKTFSVGFKMHHPLSLRAFVMR